MPRAGVRLAESWRNNISRLGARWPWCSRVQDPALSRAREREPWSTGSVLRAAGETLVLLGRSGAGKTTTLKLVNRLLTPTSGGRCGIAGEAAVTVGGDAAASRHWIRDQEADSFPTSGRGECGLCAVERWPQDRTEQRVRELLALVGLDPGTLQRASHINSRRPAPARRHRPRAGPRSTLLLLDERSGRLTPSRAWSCGTNSVRLAGRLGSHGVRHARRA